MRKGEFFDGEYYHIWNRGIEKRNIFLDEKDYIRFLTTIFVFQGNAVFNPFSHVVEHIEKIMFVRKKNILTIEPSRFNMDKKFSEFTAHILNKQIIELIAFILLPNHFHLLVRQIKKRGISSYMSRGGNSYTKYFNIRHKRKGPLFEGTFNSTHIDTQEYLDYLSAYVHKNISQSKQWRGKEWLYPWSSFNDYVQGNNWGGLLKLDDLLNHFESNEEYKNFILATPIKEEET